MKKIIASVMALILSVSLCACAGGNEGGPKPSESTAPTGQQTPAGPVGYTVTYGGVRFGLDMDAASVIKELGEASDRAVTESCAFSGYDIVYDYRSVKISTNDELGYERIYCIELMDDMAQTEEGIKIGSTADAVNAAYGDPSSTNSAGVIYAKDGMELRIFLKNDKVTAIQYLLEGAA